MGDFAFFFISVSYVSRTKELQTPIRRVWYILIPICALAGIILRPTSLVEQAIDSQGDAKTCRAAFPLQPVSRFTANR